jgi:3-hydroxybutyryl-CoA dehydrogenase
LQRYAVAGYQVVIRDLSQQILDETRAEVVDRKWGLKRSVERGKLGFDLAAAAIERIGYTLDLARAVSMVRDVLTCWCQAPTSQVSCIFISLYVS